MKLLLISIFLYLASASCAARADASNWTEDSSSGAGPLHLFTMPSKSGYDAIRITTTTSANFKALLATLIDVPALTHWMSSLTSAKVIERENPQHYVLHMTYHFPWPYHDRDSVTQDSLTRNPQTGAVTLAFHTVKRPNVPKAGHVRMTEAKGFWKLIPLTGGQTAVIYEAELDPGGALPAWAFNMSNASAAKATVQSFIKTAKLDSKPHLPFLISDLTK